MVTTSRRNRMDLNVPAETAIQNAIWEVEKVGASPSLTEAVILLGKAKDLVSDYIDNVKDSKPEIQTGGFM